MASVTGRKSFTCPASKRLPSRTVTEIGNANRISASQFWIFSRGLRGSLWLVAIQSECHQRVVHAGAGSYNHKLPARACAVRHWDRSVLIGDLPTPDFLAGLLVERIEIAVAGANEHETA